MVNVTLEGSRTAYQNLVLASGNQFSAIHITVPACTLVHTKLAQWNADFKFAFQKYFNAGAKICAFYISYLFRREGTKPWPFALWAPSRGGLQSPRLVLRLVCSPNKALLSSSSRQELTTCLPLALRFTLGSLFFNNSWNTCANRCDFFPLCLQRWPQTKRQPGECSWERKKKKKTNNLWNVFLLLRAPTLPCSGERLPWLALAASSSQRGFLSSGLQLDSGQRMGARGMHLTTT